MSETDVTIYARHTKKHERTYLNERGSIGLPAVRVTYPVKLKDSDIKKLIIEGTERLLARAGDNRSLQPDFVSNRIRTTVDKYLLRHDTEADAAAIRQFVDGLQADDLCLIMACEAGDQEAWSELVERFSATVRSAARSASANEEAAEDLAQSIWAELYGLRTRPDGSRAGKLAYYSGKGSLAGWLRAVVAQLAVDEHRKQSRLIQAEEDTELERWASNASASGLLLSSEKVSSNPEQSVVNREAGEAVQEALVRAIDELTPEDRLLVKLYYFDDLRLREAGTVLGVHEATASRRLTRVHSELKRRVATILVEQRGWTKAETERTFSEIAINLQSDIEAMWETRGVGEKQAKTEP